VARLEPLLARAVEVLLREDSRVRLLAYGVQREELERAVARWAPGVLVVDEHVQHALLARMRRVHPALRVLVLAHSPSPLLRSVLQAHAIQCVDVAGPARQLLAAIHRAPRRSSRAAAGARVDAGSGIKARAGVEAGAGTEAGAAALAGAVGLGRGTGAEGLSAREGEVLAHLRQGRTVKETALDLGISTHTVWTHTANIRRKLGAQSKRDLIEMARWPDARAPGPHTHGK
jgi:DNA-binding CsgD family transcriptional regulator